MFLHFYFFIACLLILGIGTLSTSLHGQDISFCYTTGGKLIFYVYFYACLLFSWTSTLSSFFHSVSFCNSICRYLTFMSCFFMSVFLYPGFVSCLPIFFRVRIFHSVHHRQTIDVFMHLILVCLSTFSRTSTLSAFFTVRMFRSVTACAGV